MLETEMDVGKERLSLMKMRKVLKDRLLEYEFWAKLGGY
jgi:hypothetical protein